MPDSARTAHLLILFLGAMVFLQALSMAQHTPLGAPPDEMAHISYIQDAIASNTLLPNYESGKIIPGTKPNYLSHPPLFYSISGLFGKLLSLDAREDFFFFRVLNALFVTAGFTLLLGAASRLAHDQVTLLALTMACLATPMFGYLAGSINNDNLLYLGIALVFFTIVRTRLQPLNFDVLGGVALSAGLTITLLTKATGAAFLVFFAMIYLVANRTATMRLLRETPLLGYLAIPLAIALVYYGYTFVVHGKLFPHSGGLYSKNPPENAKDVIEVAQIFAFSLFNRLSRVMSHLPVWPFSEPGRVAFYVMFFTPVIAWLAWRPFARRQSADSAIVKITDCVLVALLLVGLLHFYIVHDAYRKIGIFPGIQPRYYFYLVPLIWLLTLSIPRGRLQRTVLVVFLLSSAIAFWSASPVFLLKQSDARENRTPATAIDYPAPQIGRPTPLDFKLGASARGRIDVFKSDRNTLRVQGWALDQNSQQPALRVLLVADGRYLGAAEPSRSRPDIAKAFGSQQAGSSGFEIVVRKLPPGFDRCTIDIYSESRDGVLRALHNKWCAQ